MSEELLNNYKLEGKKLTILEYPDPVLTTVAQPVTEFDSELKELCKNMLFTMYHAPGIGLAAPQIGLSKRIFVIDVDYNREKIEGTQDQFSYSNFNPHIFINPKLIDPTGETTYEEGCLSVPGIYEEVKRFDTLKVQFQDINGNNHEIEAEELLSICIQHENDHLDGIVFIEKLSRLKKNMFKKKLLKRKKEKAKDLNYV